MAGRITVFDPTAPARARKAITGGARPALCSLSGKVVGFIDNAKPNFGALADDIGELLVARYGAKRVIKHRKPASSVPAKPEVIEQFARECDLVITGSGD